LRGGVATTPGAAHRHLRPRAPGADMKESRTSSDRPLAPAWRSRRQVRPARCSARRADPARTRGGKPGAERCGARREGSRVRIP
jgi:hypothetical protein